MKKKEPMLFPKKTLQEGDIVFRRGTGIASQAVLAMDKKGVYTHVGMVVNEDGMWKVVHAVPGETDRAEDPDRVKIEAIATFFAPEKAISGALMRVMTDSIIRSKAAQLAVELCRKKVLFDHEYNKDDTTKMYCSELVEFVYSRSGLDLVEGRYSELNLPIFSGTYLLPSDIQKSKYLKIVDYF